MAASAFLSAPAQSVTLDFSAVLVEGTCTISLDKSTLDLGTITKSQLRAGQVVAPQPFALTVQGCSGGGPTLTPVVKVSGNGIYQDNKYLFRNAGSADGVGILLFISDTVPEYNDSSLIGSTHIQVGFKGTTPAKLNFYAGISCGGAMGCATTGTGNVTANIMFTFAYI
ncbi:fimbrial protein [Serratia fonticola]|uniref:fimbrial protein n=1 Tax=Serratia fonticola TaxID=47917 RepID=UPI0021BD6DE1|nr:fimbrial protein [Serratia fonticola]